MPLGETLRRIAGLGPETLVEPRVVDAIFGDVSPENIKRKTQEYRSFQDQYKPGDAEERQWFRDNTSGIMEEVLVLFGDVATNTGLAMSNVGQVLQNIQAEGDDAQLAERFREQAPKLMEVMGDLVGIESRQFTSLIDEVSDIRNALLQRK